MGRQNDHPSAWFGLPAYQTDNKVSDFISLSCKKIIRNNNLKYFYKEFCKNCVKKRKKKKNM